MGTRVDAWKLQRSCKLSPALLSLLLNAQLEGIPGWLSGLVPPSAQGVILETRDRAPHGAPETAPCHRRGLWAVPRGHLHPGGQMGEWRGSAFQPPAPLPPRRPSLHSWPELNKGKLRQSSSCARLVRLLRPRGIRQLILSVAVSTRPGRQRPGGICTGCGFLTGHAES